jgi:hypothetical protein
VPPGCRDHQHRSAKDRRNQHRRRRSFAGHGDIARQREDCSGSRKLFATGKPSSPQPEPQHTSAYHSLRGADPADPPNNITTRFMMTAGSSSRRSRNRGNRTARRRRLQREAPTSSPFRASTILRRTPTAPQCPSQGDWRAQRYWLEGTRATPRQRRVQLKRSPDPRPRADVNLQYSSNLEDEAYLNEESSVRTGTTRHVPAGSPSRSPSTIPVRCAVGWSWARNSSDAGRRRYFGQSRQSERDLSAQT